MSQFYTEQFMSIYYQRNAHLFCLESPVLEVLPKLRAILEGRIVRRKVAQVAKIFGNIDHLHGFLQFVYRIVSSRPRALCPKEVDSNQKAWLVSMTTTLSLVTLSWILRVCLQTSTISAVAGWC